MTSVSFIVATIDRPSLARTLDSIEVLPGDEVLVVAERPPACLRPDVHRFVECQRGNDWGHSERNYATPLARGAFLSFMDDDDYYAPGHRAAMAAAIEANPTGPTIFSMRLHHMAGTVLWRHQEIVCGNVGTPMFFAPNDLGKLGTWPPVYGGDCTFMQSCR